MFTLLMRHAGNGRRYIQVPVTSAERARGVRAANTAWSRIPSGVKGRAFGALYAPRRAVERRRGDRRSGLTMCGVP